MPRPKRFVGALTLMTDQVRFLRVLYTRKIMTLYLTLWSFYSVFTSKTVIVTFLRKNLRIVSNLSPRNQTLGMVAKNSANGDIKVFGLALYVLIFLHCSKHFYLALQLCCLKKKVHFSLQQKRTRKAGLLLDTTDVIVQSSALNNNGSIEVKTDQIGNLHWELFI